MRSSPHDTAIAHANLLPFPLLVNKVRQAAALRLATLPESHPLHKLVQNAANRYVKSHPTPLHELMYTYKIQPKTMEKLATVRKSTRWKSKLSTKIADTREQAIAEEKIREGKGWRIYTDGSGLGGMIGAAAVVYKGEEVKGSLRCRLGEDNIHTVFEGKGVGMVLGVELARRIEINQTIVVHMGVDNHAAIHATTNNQPTTSHHIWDILHKNVERLK
ncbi:hypothetical protein CPB83DRAFT_778471, partial [Crepidotus variabilis]